MHYYLLRMDRADVAMTLSKALLTLYDLHKVLRGFV